MTPGTGARPFLSNVSWLIVRSISTGPILGMCKRPHGLAAQLSADSDEVARVKRDEAARDSWMMSPAVTE
jgi:hypothetical protein